MPLSSIWVERHTRVKEWNALATLVIKLIVNVTAHYICGL